MRHLSTSNSPEKSIVKAKTASCGASCTDYPTTRREVADSNLAGALSRRISPPCSWSRGLRSRSARSQTRYIQDRSRGALTSAGMFNAWKFAEYSEYCGHRVRRVHGRRGFFPYYLSVSPRAEGHGLCARFVFLPGCGILSRADRDPQNRTTGARNSKNVRHFFFIHIYHAPPIHTSREQRILAPRLLFPLINGTDFRI